MLGRIKKTWKILGPGLITGAVDNDTSAIAAYTIAGATIGTGQLWLLLYVLPFMIAVQKMCARIGALTGCGLAANIKRHYPNWILVLAVVLLVSANVFTIGADLYGMAGALNLVVPVDIKIMAVVMALIAVGMIIFLKYHQIEMIFKWFALSLVVYGAALVLVVPDWGKLFWATVIPTFRVDREFIMTAFAVLGTTISPYIFFWQASEEAEDTNTNHPRVRVCKYHMLKPGTLADIDQDTRIGMIFSNVISFFIMALAATTIFRGGGEGLVTLREAAEALRPLAGPYAFGLFAIGIISSGMLAIPVLAGSAAYAIAELMGWPASLNRSFTRAKQFYFIIILSVALGMLLPFLGITPIEALWWAAILNGLIVPILIMLVIHMAHNPQIVGPHKFHIPTYALSIGALFLMLTGTLVVLFT